VKLVGHDVQLLLKADIQFAFRYANGQTSSARSYIGSLTSQNVVPVQKIITKKLSAVYATGSSVSVHNSPHPVPISNQINPVRYITLCVKNQL
jgi:hypothetical protein